MGKSKGRRSSIRWKLRLALLTMAVPILLLGGLGIWAIDSSTTMFEAAADEQVTDSLAIIGLRDNLITSEWWAMEYANEGKKKARGKFLALVPKIETGITQILSMDTGTEKVTAEGIAESWSIAGRVGLRAMALPPGSSDTEVEYPLEDFHPAVELAIGDLVELNEKSLEDMRAEVHAIKERRDNLVQGLGIAIGVYLIVAFVVSRRSKKLIQQPLARLEEAAQKFGDHDFDHRIQVARKDEFGRVGDAFNAMARRVSTSQSASEELERQLRYQALHDSLTGLANRTLFSNRVTHAIQQIDRSHTTTAVLFLDIDNFKALNDTFGHDTGDEILTAVAERLEGCIRVVDTAARLGGDEFAVLLTDMANADDPDIVAARIIESMGFVFRIGEIEHQLGVSIGVAINDNPHLAGKELLRQADVAMYSAKAAGKNAYVIFDHTMDDQLASKAKLEAQLMRSIATDELEALFQPIVELATGHVIGAEALLRWIHPTDGRLTPDKFLPLAEESGFVAELDAWILNKACTRAAAWTEELGRDIRIAVNLSGRTLQRDDLVETVASVLRQTGLKPQNLVLEMTESVFVQSRDGKKLRELKDLGVRLALDDFGTGYSSLNYLRRFPIDILKIDRSFVGELSERTRGGNLTKAIVQMAEALQLETIAEGVETQDQADVLIELGVVRGQGFFYHRPLEESALLPVMKNSGIKAAV
jgi:diguanylate cyclase (GGDEF)-like protein